MNLYEVIALCATVMGLVVVFALMYYRDAQRDCGEFEEET